MLQQTSEIHGFRMQGVFDTLEPKGPFGPFAQSISTHQQRIQQY